MKKSTFLFVVIVTACIWSASTYTETVWMKDMTTRLKTDKRTLSDLSLADELTYHLMRGSNTLTLNLKRNHGIDPDADIYVVKKLKDGRSVLEKTQNLAKEELAYYQDIENGAFMTIQCVKTSIGQCERVINGNIRIENRDYDLRPAETSVDSRNFLEVPGVYGKRYVLEDQGNIQRKNSLENKGTAIVNEKNLEQEFTDIRQRFSQGQDDKIHFPRTGTFLHRRGTTVIRENTPEVYDVGVAVLIDPGEWDLFWSLDKPSNIRLQEDCVKRKIRRFFSHIFNGVNLRYKGIEDPSIVISVTLSHFIMFQRESDFPYGEAEVEIINGTKYMNVRKYLNDVRTWETFLGFQHPEYDHAMLFTKFDLYFQDLTNNGIRGMSWNAGVCLSGLKTSVIEVGDYFITVNAATHELGHNLGAEHDGTGDANRCRSEDLFIMSGTPLEFHPRRPYTRNPWLFSTCSVKAFKKTLPDKECVHSKSSVYNQNEWTNFTAQQPGEEYNLNEQCEFVMGYKSTYCGGVAADICRFMKCTDPKTGQCPDKYFSAARGTECQSDMWCIEGRCVPKR